MNFLVKRFPLILLLTSRYIRGSRVTGLLSLKSRVSFVVMAVGVSLLIVVLSIFNGFQRQLKESLWQGGEHITIESSSNGGEIRDYEKIIEFIHKTPELNERIIAVEGGIQSHGLIQKYNIFYPVLIKAVPVPSVDDLLANKLHNFPRVVHYNRDELGQMNRENFIILGKEMEGLYNFGLGKQLTLAVPGGRFSLGKGVEVSVENFRVSGFFKTGNYKFDSSFVYMALPTAQKFFKMRNSVNQITIKVKSLDDLSFCKRKLHRLFSEAEFENAVESSSSLSVRTIAEEQENLLAALRLEKTIISIIVFLFIILAALGMVASVYSLVRAKRKSIGVLKALGIPSSDILLIFTMNAMLVGILASLTGGVTGIFLANSLESIIGAIEEVCNSLGPGLWTLMDKDWTPVELVPKRIYYFDKLPVDINIAFIFMVTTAATILSGIAGYFPARWAASLNPVDTIRND
ncbi:ABC transporter permease [Leptospira wolffii]|uniref:ABC transporter permease n=1 Tax=Leptospira wolffii TaxID=409998 RepID=A0A2M9ZE72_9LEPT|nr:FtsX-like permease family protein [Leptospira wolffii]EPG65356.1 MacB-like periplasmic core domain protein [Leptospira wolffii serovar Khorat str. Khorat-H2]PJZ66674.1 ABC transporter permease [Leptospira wolffii]TGK61649.1 ABC transporter permease [Leptospira wolffii]TGK70193.1 ABC transporter permease [Leptospira wolffii]TGK77116.1 ABC transporter permease [Leptospira wolffii]